jgi:hypothetical protein
VVVKREAGRTGPASGAQDAVPAPRATLPAVALPAALADAAWAGAALPASALAGVAHEVRLASGDTPPTE